MLTYYYDIKDEGKIPSTSKFVDPYDHEVYKPQPNESFPQFITRITESRSDKGKPAIKEQDLRQLVIDSLVLTGPKGKLGQYFVEKKAFPTMQGLLAFITTLAYDLVKSKGISVKQQEDRLDDCLNNCMFHKKPGSGGFSATTKKIINAVTSLVTTTDLKKTKHELAGTPIGNCRMCGGCELKEKTKFSTGAVFAGLNPENISSILKVYKAETFNRCWQLREAADSPTLRPKLITKIKAAGLPAEQLLAEYDASKKKNKDK